MPAFHLLQLTKLNPLKPGLIVCLGLLCCIAFSGRLHAAEKTAPTANKQQIVLKAGAPQLTSLKIEAVTEMPVPATEPLNGKIVLDENKTARIFSPVAGRALSIKAQIGDRVTAGQALLEMDSPDVGAAVADERKALADLALKKQALARSQMLLEGGVIANKEVEVAQADWATAMAEHTRTSSRLKNLGVSTRANDRYWVRAPISGVVVERKVNPGIEIRPDAQDPLFLITDPRYVWAMIDLPERELSRIAVGQKISLEVDAYPDQVFSGEISTIGVMLDPTTRRVPVRCRLDSLDKLKPEMYARITPLDTKQHRVIRIPNSALITEGLYNYVFVETQPLHFIKRSVTLDVQRREYATVKAGLNLGERVVTIGALLLNAELSVGP